MAEWSCSGCGAREGYLVAEARIPNYEFSNSVEPLTLTAAWVKTGKGLLGGGGERIPVKLGARVCGGCGRVELAVLDLTVLEGFAKGGLGGVTRF
jgi:hypothetical protein